MAVERALWGRTLPPHEGGKAEEEELAALPPSVPPAPRCCWAMSPRMPTKVSARRVIEGGAAPALVSGEAARGLAAAEGWGGDTEPAEVDPEEGLQPTRMLFACMGNRMGA